MPSPGRCATASGRPRPGPATKRPSRQLIAKLSPLLWPVARAAGLASDDAEEVVQTTWRRLVSQLDDIRTPTTLRAWLVLTAKCEAWRVRAAGRKQLLADDAWLTGLADRSLGSEEQAVITDEQRTLGAALAQLSPRCQELLRIIAFGPLLDFQAVADALRMPRGSIGPTRGRRLAKLRALLADEPEGSARIKPSDAAGWPPADGPLDEFDLRHLHLVRELFEQVDPMPADLPERIRFSPRLGLEANRPV